MLSSKAPKIDTFRAGKATKGYWWECNCSWLFLLFRRSLMNRITEEPGSLGSRRRYEVKSKQSLDAFDLLHPERFFFASVNWSDAVTWSIMSQKKNISHVILLHAINAAGKMFELSSNIHQCLSPHKTSSSFIWISTSQIYSNISMATSFHWHQLHYLYEGE